MGGEKTLSAMSTALTSAGYEVFSTDKTNSQLQLSACLNSATGKWVLSPVANFAAVCGGSPPAPGPPPPAPSPGPPGPSPGGSCPKDAHGPPCTKDAECTDITDCVRCAKSGYCTSTPKAANTTSASASA